MLSLGTRGSNCSLVPFPCFQVDFADALALLLALLPAPPSRRGTEAIVGGGKII